MNADREAVADIVPVDLPVNMMILTAWYTVLTKPKDILIYHSTTGGINPFTWGELGMSLTFTYHIYCYLALKFFISSH